MLGDYKNSDCMIVAVENAFGMKFNMGQVNSMKNVGEMADIIMSKSSTD